MENCEWESYGIVRLLCIERKRNIDRSLKINFMVSSHYNIVLHCRIPSERRIQDTFKNHLELKLRINKCVLEDENSLWYVGLR